MALQEQIVEYWNESAEGYSGYIHMELASFRGKAWTDLIRESLPEGKTGKVLDIGTGPGFFSIILSKAGFQVTAVDCTANMIAEAQKNARLHQVTPEYLVMDSHHLDFPENTFDLIVNRNVTWTLHHPKTAYKEWMRVLKPGGKLMIFDANWHMFHYDEILAKKMKKAEEEYRLKYGEPFVSCKNHQIEDYSKDVPLANINRPDWDFKTLKGLGFSRVETDTNIIERVYDEQEMLLYGCTPLFKIVATK